MVSAVPGVDPAPERRKNQLVNAPPPGAWDLYYSLRRFYVDQFFGEHAARLPRDCRVLDLGGNRTQKRGHFDIEQLPLQVTYANLVPDKKPDVVCDASMVPFGDRMFDALICGELLEHVPDPRLVLAEASRLLEPEGRLLITVPFLIPIHGDPDDYGRYTDHYWRAALAQAGFAEVQTARQGLWRSVVVEMMRARLANARDRGRLGGGVRRSLASWTLGVSARWAIRADAASADDPFLSRFTTGFGITAVRREAV
jgi:SAM-dependent methyltransferase